ncbi:hypothetical protein ALC53_08195 [Atta colombica]|uniref:Uncharacterized protein n=1 Tax=Atta colombica TaxID=520822 RepID=A0A195BB17_9HYME|nr:hypothetical protein ALC53_08195 [Atta colombica]
MASLFVGSRYACKADCEFNDHIRLIIRAVSGLRFRGVERKEGLSGMDDAGVTIEQAGKQEKQRSFMYRGRFSRTIVRSATLAHCQRAATRGRLFTPKVLRNVIYEACLSI